MKVSGSSGEIKKSEQSERVCESKTMSYFCVDNEIMIKIKFRWSAKFKGLGNRVNKSVFLEKG